jgi:hypothetical protein
MRFRFQRFDWVLLAIAIAVNLWPGFRMSMQGWGTMSFGLEYRQVHIGMTLQEWEDLRRPKGIESMCDGTSCYVHDFLRTYHVIFKKRGDEPLKIWSKTAYVHWRREDWRYW